MIRNRDLGNSPRQRTIWIVTSVSVNKLHHNHGWQKVNPSHICHRADSFCYLNHLKFLGASPCRPTDSRARIGDTRAHARWSADNKLWLRAWWAKNGSNASNRERYGSRWNHRRNYDQRPLTESFDGLVFLTNPLIFRWRGSSKSLLLVVPERKWCGVVYMTGSKPAGIRLVWGGVVVVGRAVALGLSG